MIGRKLPAKPYRGQRIRLRAKVAATDGGRAQLWLLRYFERHPVTPDRALEELNGLIDGLGEVGRAALHRFAFQERANT